MKKKIDCNITPHKCSTKSISKDEFESLGSEFQTVLFDIDTANSCSVAFMTSKCVFLIYKNNHNKRINLENGPYERNVQMYQLKNKLSHQNVVASFHSIIQYNNCENKMYLNTPSFVFTSNKTCDLNEILNYFERQSIFKKTCHFKTNNHLSREDYLHVNYCVMNNIINNKINEKERLKQIDLFMILQQLKHKCPKYAQIVASYVMFFKEQFKELILHESSINELPNWIVQDMIKWLTEKKCTFNTLIDMIKNYKIDYVQKDESKTLLNQWDYGMRTNLDKKLENKMEFIKWYYDNLF